jgi:hypothetical protein
MAPPVVMVHTIEPVTPEGANYLREGEVSIP